jgi:hypothetical protein
LLMLKVKSKPLMGPKNGLVMHRRLTCKYRMRRSVISFSCDDYG